MFLDLGVHFHLGDLDHVFKTVGLVPTQFLILPFPNSVSQVYQGVILTSPCDTTALRIFFLANHTRLRPCLAPCQQKKKKKRTPKALPSQCMTWNGPKWL